MFDFAVETVPLVADRLLRKARLPQDAIDLFVLHQANDRIVKEISKRMGISEDRCPFLLNDGGNTVSSTIPIALKRAMNEGRLREGQLLMLIGFGVGLSWAARIVRWTAK